MEAKIHTYNQLGKFLFPIVAEETQNFAKGIYKHILLDMLANNSKKFSGASLEEGEDGPRYIEDQVAFFKMCKKVGLFKEAKIEKNVKVSATDLYYEMAKTKKPIEIAQWACDKHVKK